MPKLTRVERGPGVLITIVDGVGESRLAVADPQPDDVVPELAIGHRNIVTVSVRIAGLGDHGNGETSDTAVAYGHP